MKVTEATMQAVLMRWLMNTRNHELVIPNSTQFFFWEADLISITRAGLVHEFEIKICKTDYKRDAQKHKHHFIGEANRSPAYFWYATFGFEIDPPENAGWLSICYDESKFIWTVNVKKEAPRLNSWKIDETKRRQIARLLSWRLTKYYEQYLFVDAAPAPVQMELAP